ncbi:M3 family metallopeptidase [Sulfurospirillum sp. 1612]|uniref:M3 family metallopeptidase n=1 Tax=Sulfurospirillum sp. 1612 TaxID=3094835 RepID=UPI002F94BCBD
MNKFLKFEVDFDHFIEKLQEKINQNNQTIEKLLKIEHKTYDNFVRPLEILEEKMDEFFTPMSHLNSVKNSETTQKVYSQSLPIITEYATKLSQNLDIYNAFKSIEASEKAQLNQEQLRVLELNIQSFELSGANLDEKKKKRLEAINLRMSELANDFSQNLINAVNDYELILDEDDVKGLSEEDKKSYEIDVDGAKKYRFTLQMPPYITYMTYGQNREIREKLYKAYTTKAPQNAAIIDELMQLRQEMSHILGFENYAAYSLAPKMAEKEEAVISFLEKLAHAAKPIAKQELATLRTFAKQEDLQSYDLAFYSEKLKKETYDFDQDLYRPYFEQHSVVAGLFKFLNLLFGIRFEKVEVPLWDEKASAYNVMVGDKLTARLYLDLESRQGKSGGAWMHNWQSHYKEGGTEHLASAFIVCNFPSSEKSPSLLRHDDVVTLFHEMGHALHHMLSNVSEVGVSGISGVEWDAVEFPSQFLENFAYEPKVLKIFAAHYKSGEILSDAMIDKIVAVKNFQSALGILRQVEFSLFDFKLHQKLHQGQEVQDLLNQVRAENSLIQPPAYNKFQNGFSHIFAGGYAAGYYSYKWAEVLSADAFFAIVDQGIFNTKFGKDYLNIVLAQGGSRSMKALYKELKGADAKVESLLRLSGLTSKSEAS